MTHAWGNYEAISNVEIEPCDAFLVCISTASIRHHGCEVSYCDSLALIRLQFVNYVYVFKQIMSTYPTIYFSSFGFIRLC